MDKRTTLAWILLVVALPVLAVAEERGDGRDEDCDCDALAAELNGVDVEIGELEDTLEGYRQQLSIPGKIATSLEGYGVRAVEGRCNEGEGRVGLEAGWKFCFPIGNSAEVIPFITDFLDQLGYDPKDFRDAAINADDVEEALDKANERRERLMADCARCRCECA